MTRNTHSRELDHHGVDLATDLVLAQSTSTYVSGSTLQAVLGNIDERVSVMSGAVSVMSGAIENGLDFRQSEAAPSSATEGYSYYDTTIRKVRTWDGSDWKDHW